MELDQLLNLTSVVAGKVLPIVGVVALVFLIIFLRKLIVVMISANDSLTAMKTTLDTANRQLESLDKPLATINEISDTIDNVHEASRSAVKSLCVAIVENFGSIKDSIFSGKGKTPTSTDEVDRGEENGE